MFVGEYGDSRELTNAKRSVAGADLLLSKDQPMCLRHARQAAFFLKESNQLNYRSFSKLRAHFALIFL